MSDQHDTPLLQIVVCVAGVAADVGWLITAAQERCRFSEEPRS
ncbi:hypothetical protein [Streptomyces sp. NBC_01707]